MRLELKIEDETVPGYGEPPDPVLVIDMFESDGQGYYWVGYTSIPIRKLWEAIKQVM